MIQTTWRTLFLDVRFGLFIPRLVTWDPETGEFTCVGADPPVRDRAGGGEDAECDRQVERGTFFPEVGRGQVHGDPVGRKGKAGVADRGAHPLAALAHCRVRKPYRGERGQARRDVDLYPHE